MRTAILGVGHWHAKFIFEALTTASDVVAVSEPDPALREAAAQRLGCKAYQDFRELLDRENVDAVFVYGRHSGMAEMAEEAVARGIPFMLEKPGGLTAAQVARVRDRATAAGVFATVPFSHRIVPWVRRIDAGELQHAQFRLLSGPPSRYLDQGVPWVLDRVEAGGGCTINLSILFVDLFRYLTGRPLRLEHARMSTLTAGLRVEDYSSLVVSTVDGEVGAVIETGYTFPIGAGSDVSASVRTRGAYHLVSGDLTTVTTAAGEVETGTKPTHHREYYGEFAVATLRAIASGEPPLATLDDLYQAMLIIDAAYGNPARGVAGW